MAQVPDNLRSRAEKLSGRWSQKCPPRMRTRGNTKEIVSEDSKSPLYHSRGFLELVGRRVFCGAGEKDHFTNTSHHFLDLPNPYKL